MNNGWKIPNNKFCLKWFETSIKRTDHSALNNFCKKAMNDSFGGFYDADGKEKSDK